MSHSKSPYEIRSDLLHLAFSIVSGQKQAAAEQTAKDDHKEGKPSQIFETESPTTEEVVTEATKLNNFVSQSSSP